MRYFIKHAKINLLIVFSFLSLLLVSCNSGNCNTNPSPPPPPQEPDVVFNLDNGTFASLSPIFNLTFVKPLNVDTLNSTNIVLTRVETASKNTVLSATNIPLSSFITNLASDNVVFSPIAKLESNTTYKLSLNNLAFSNGQKIKDSSFTFTTGSVDKPSVVALSPANNATNI